MFRELSNPGDSVSAKQSVRACARQTASSVYQQKSPSGGTGWAGRKTARNSERIAQTHLKLTLAALACDLVGGRLGWPGVRRAPILAAPARLVDEAEHLAAELQAVAFSNLKALQDAQIPALETRALDQTAIFLTGRRSRSRSCNNGKAIRVSGSEPEVAVTRCQSERSPTAK